MENIIKKVIGDSGIPLPTTGHEPNKPLKIPNLPPARPKGPSDVPAHQAPRADGSGHKFT